MKKHLLLWIQYLLAGSYVLLADVAYKFEADSSWLAIDVETNPQFSGFDQVAVKAVGDEILEMLLISSISSEEISDSAPIHKHIFAFIDSATRSNPKLILDIAPQVIQASGRSILVLSLSDSEKARPYAKAYFTGTNDGLICVNHDSVSDKSISWTDQTFWRQVSGLGEELEENRSALNIFIREYDKLRPKLVDYFDRSEN